MIAPLHLVLAVAAGGLAAAYAYGELKRPGPALAAGAGGLLAGLLPGQWGGPALAAGFVLTRAHPLLLPVPPLAAAVAGEPGALAVAASWLWGSRVPWAASAVASLVAALGSPALGAASLIVGVPFRLLRHHPGRVAWSRTLREVAPWALPVPCAALMVLAAIERATPISEWLIFGYAYAGVALGLGAAVALRGLALRFLASDGNAHAWASALVGAALVIGAGLALDSLDRAQASMGPLLVVGSLAGAPALAKLRWRWLAVRTADPTPP